MFKKRLTGVLSFGLILGLLSVTLIGCGSDSAKDDSFPSREVTIIGPFEPGGGTDTSIMEGERWFEEELGTSVQMDYRPGASTIVGTEIMAKSKPDGYTIGALTSPHYELSVMFLDAPYKFEDIVILGTHATDPGVIRIRKDEDRFHDFDSMIQWALDNPGQLTWSVSAVTSSNYFGIKLIEEATGAKFNIVNFNGGNPARIALAGGHVDVTHAGIYNSLHIAEDTKAIAVHYNNNPAPELTDNAPTINDLLGKKIPDTGSIYGLFAPRIDVENPDRFEKLCDAYEKAYNNEEYLEFLEETGKLGIFEWHDHKSATELSEERRKDLEKYSYFFDEEVEQGELE